MEHGGYVPEESRLSLQDTTLELQGERPLHVFLGSTLELKNALIEVNETSVNIHDGILEVEGTQDLTGVIFDDTRAMLRLTEDATLNDSSALSVYSLELEDFALTLDDQMAGMSVSQAVTLDAATEQIVSGNADLSLNGGIAVNAGILSSTSGILSASSFNLGAEGTVNIQGGTLTLPAGGTAVTGAEFTTSDTTISLGGTLEVADTWTSTNTNLSLTSDASLLSTNPLVLATLATNGHDFDLDSVTTDLTLANAFTLSSGKMSTHGADLIFESSAEISSESTLDAGDGGKFEFRQGGTANGTINAESAVFKIAADYTFPGTLRTNSTTTWDLGTSNLDLSGGLLSLGGNV